MEAFRNGGGVSYDQIGEEIPCAIERFFRRAVAELLASQWIPAVDGGGEAPKGARVADLGCGRGQSTVNMAKAFPESLFVGVDYHSDSIEAARELAKREGVENVAFVQGSAETTPNGTPYDLVTTFDCIHDMTDPAATIRRIREVMAEDGVWLWSEPNASHEPNENRNPVGRVFQSVSPMHCMTVSLAHGGAGLGTVIGEKGARELAEQGGFGSFERLPIDNPFNQFFAVRK
ncbi:MAG: class I SAM-dependent methyltransferase [Bryobacterales bacterium]